jgi:hypothetical protein
VGILSIILSTLLSWQLSNIVGRSMTVVFGNKIRPLSQSLPLHRPISRLSQNAVKSGRFQRSHQKNSSFSLRTQETTVLGVLFQCDTYRRLFWLPASQLRALSQFCARGKILTSGIMRRNSLWQRELHKVPISSSLFLFNQF